jgi:acetyl-CoA C-acetyltransferase
LKNVFIAGANRTAIGKFGGSLADWTAADMGTVVTSEAVRRAGLKSDKIDEVIFGNARQAGGGPNVARQIGYRAGMPEAVPAYTVNQACGSGLRSIILACNEIRLGNSEVIIAGGAESMSRVPYYAEGARWGARLGNLQLTDGMYKDGFLCPLSGLVMGETAEKLATQYNISREEQDRYALRSQQRAEAASKEGRFNKEITPLELKSKKGTNEFKSDEHIFAGATIEKLGKLAPVFSKSGTVTAGNASGITDGAAAMIVISEEAANREGVSPQARIVDYTVAGVDPSIMGIGPVPAVKQLLERQKLPLDKIDLIELNEAFAAQVLACDRELKFDHDRLNVNGGAIALGHPIGCTGTRIVVTLIHELIRSGGRRGLATLCISGGMGIAMLIERV